MTQQQHETIESIRYRFVCASEACKQNRSDGNDKEWQSFQAGRAEGLREALTMLGVTARAPRALEIERQKAVQSRKLMGMV